MTYDAWNDKSDEIASATPRNDRKQTKGLQLHRNGKFMKQILIFIFYLLPFTFYLSICLYSEVGVGLGWPYLGVKYNFSQRLGSELRWATGEGINVYAGRGYWNYYSSRKLTGFTGLEGGYISFDTLDTKGTGYEGSVFLGGEYFITKRGSFALDFAPTFIGLKSDEFKIDGVEWVANLAVYYYFGNTDEHRYEAQINTDEKAGIATDKGEIGTIETEGADQGSATTNDSEKKKLMREHFNKAGQLYQQKKYEEAIKEWE
ncbi:MAG: hypothetical protein AB1349_06930 [Elusimicrobiota bacterium]